MFGELWTDRRALCRCVGHSIETGNWLRSDLAHRAIQRRARERTARRLWYAGVFSPVIAPLLLLVVMDESDRICGVAVGGGFVLQPQHAQAGVEEHVGAVPADSRCRAKVRDSFRLQPRWVCLQKGMLPHIAIPQCCVHGYNFGLHACFGNQHREASCDVNTMQVTTQLDALRSIYGSKLVTELLEFKHEKDSTSSVLDMQYKAHGYISNANYK